MNTNYPPFTPYLSKLWKEQRQLRVELRDVNMDHWLHYNLFSLVWWLMLVFFVAIWFVWWKKVDKSRLVEILLYGLMVTIIAIVIDIVGVELVLWGFPNMLVPLMPPLLSTDFSLLPILYMLVYQYFSSWKRFITATLIQSIILAFVAEPIAIYMGIYELSNWKSLYSFPMYIGLGLFSKWMMQVIQRIQKKKAH